MAIQIQVGADVRQGIKGLQDVSLTLKEQREILKSLQLQYAKLSTDQARSTVGKELAADIRIAKDEVSRLAITSTNSFGAVGAGASKAFGAVRQLAYVLPGIGIAGIIGGLSELAIGLFRSSDAFSSAELSAARFSQSIKDAKEGLQDFVGFLDFGADIDKLNAKLSAGLTPAGLAKGDIQGLQIDKANNEKIIKDLDDVNDRIVSRIANIRGNAQLYLGKSARELLDNFADAAIPDDLIEKLGSADEKIIRQLKADGLEIQNNREEIRKRAKENDSIDLQAQLRNQQEQKRVRDESARAYEEYVNKTISRAKELANYFKSTKVVPEFTVLDTKNQQFEKALEFLKTLDQDGFAENLAPIIFKVPATFSIDPERFKFVALGGEIQTIQEQINKYIATQNLKIAPDGMQVSFKLAINAKREEIKKIGDELKLLGEMGQFIGNSLADGFDRVFDAIAEGQSIIKAFGEAIKELVVDLIQAAVRALIVRAVTNLFAPGLGSAGRAGAIFGGFAGFRASGGAVAAGQPYVVGETGRELFVPSSSGRIIPNNSLGGAGSATPIISFHGDFGVSGNELRLLLNRTDRYQGRNA